MPNQSVNVIDLQSYRARRGMDRAMDAAKPIAPSPMPAAMVAWVPVWFVPVTFVAMPLATN